MSLETDTGGFNAGAFTTLTSGGAAAGMTATAGIDSGGPGLLVTSSSFTGIAITPAAGVAGDSYLEIDSVGTGNIPYNEMFFARGVVGALTSPQTNDLLGATYYVGYVNGGNITGAAFQVTCAENYSTGHGAVTFGISTIDSAGETRKNRVLIDGAGNTVLENGVVRLDPAGDGLGLAVASLPTGALGMMSFVKDALNPTIGSTVANGGSAKALVWYNGANWTVIGK